MLIPSIITAPLGIIYYCAQLVSRYWISTMHTVANINLTHSLLLLLLLLLSHFSRVQLCVTPSTAAHQTPLSLGFSRQEHWTGLPYHSPMHEGEKVKVKSLSHVRLSVTPWTAAHKAPLSMGPSRQEYWSGVPLPSPHVSGIIWYCLCLTYFTEYDNL